MQTPDKLVAVDGQVSCGLFDGSVRTINGSDFDYRTPMGARQGALARHFHYKQFQYFGVLSGRVLAGCALAHTGYIGLVFVYVYDTVSKRMLSETFRLPFARGLQMSDSPVAGDSGLSTRGADIRMAYRQRPDGTLEKALSVQTAKGIRIEAQLHEAAPYEVLSLCTRTGYNGWTYTNKVAGLPVSGHVESPLGRVDLAEAHACGNHDFSTGYMRRETFWNWACLSGHAGEHLVGLNLSCGVNETSHSENCVWLDGRRHATGSAQFTFDREHPERPWHVTAGDAGTPGSVDLVVTPAGLHAERMNVGLFATNFKQFFGQYSGTIRAQGKTIHVDGLWGFVEDQYAKW
ncbi:MAG: DUF2804 domain-containing protein [Gammaproteobacteria bacterium]